MQTAPSSCLEVLVVDDIAASRDALATLARELGHATRSAANAAQAMEAIAARAPHVVLLDLLLPGIDGFEMIHRIKGVPGGDAICVIAVSALDGELHFEEAVRRGADGYLVRPVSPALLEAKLRQHGRLLGLRATTERLLNLQREIQDNIGDAVVTLDASGVVLEANRAAGRLLQGSDGADLRGLSFAQVTGLPEGIPEPGLAELRPPQGTSRWIRVGRSRWRDGERELATLVLRDVSGRERTERMQDEFLAAVSHELRTPLTSVLGAVSLLASGRLGELTPAGQRLAAAAQRNGKRLNQLIDDILDVTKAEGDRLLLQMRTFMLRKVVDDAIALAGDAAAAAGVTLLAPPAQDIPEVHADPDRVLQILSQLLSNAIKHSPPGAAVQVRLAVASGQVRVTVSDTGPGVAPAFRARLFDKFVKADGSDARQTDGAGLGLYLSQLLARRMGTRVELDDTDAGASFSLALRQAHNAPPEPTP